jgi:hypothetical protein
MSDYTDTHIPVESADTAAQSAVEEQINTAIASLENASIPSEVAFQHVEAASDALSAHGKTVEGSGFDDARAATLLSYTAYDNVYSLDPIAGMDDVVLENIKAVNGGALPDEFVLDSEEEQALRADAIDQLKRAKEIINGDQATWKEQAGRIGNDLATGFVAGWALPAEEQSRETYIGAFAFDYTAGNVADALAIGGNATKIISGTIQGDTDEIVNGVTGAGVHAAALVVPTVVAKKIERPLKDAVQGALGKVAPHVDNALQAASTKWQQGTHALNEVLDTTKKISCRPYRRTG